MQYKNHPRYKSFRRHLRANMTKAEIRLWCLIKDSQLEGRKFRRQFSVGKYVLDFYCPTEKLAIELDGMHHYTPKGLDYDAARSAYLASFGIRVVRFENRLVLEQADEVLKHIVAHFRPEGS